MKAIFLLIIFCAAVPLFPSGPGPLSFADAANLAVASSADLRHAYAMQGIKEGAWMLGLRAYFPRVSISASENDRLQQLGADSFVKNYSINVEQLLWDGGRTTMSRRLEQMELGFSSAAIERMEVEIVDSALAAYRGILSARAVLAIREETLGALREQRRILNEEVGLGLALAVDLALADISLTEAEIEIYALKLDLSDMEIRFAELLGLAEMPQLLETVDINRSLILPDAGAAAALARERNPDLVQARYSIIKKQAELKYAANSWIPSIKLSSNFGLNGQQYPLTRYNWAVGINIEFSGPWIQNRFGIQAGWEPPFDRTAQIQNSVSPLPDPASSLGRRQAELALALEQEKFNTAIERIGRAASQAVEKCALAEQKRALAVRSLNLAAERCRLDELRLNLGQITRLNLMETLIEYAKKEIAAVEAATNLLESERELERFLDLNPGGLARFAAPAGR